MPIKPLEAAPIFIDQTLELPIFWSGNTAKKIVEIGGLLKKKPAYAKMKVKIDAVWPYPSPTVHLTVKVNGIEKCILPMQVVDWQEYDVIDAVRVGDNIFEAVLWTTIPAPLTRGIKFTVYLETDVSTEIRLPTQPPQLWWYALIGLIVLTFMAAAYRGVKA